MHANHDHTNGSHHSPRARRRAAAAAPRAALPSVRDVVYVLFKHKRKASCVAAGVMACTLAAAMFVSSKYTSEAQLLVRMGRESMPTATIAGGPQAMPMLDRMTEVNSEAQIVRSAGVIGRTVDRVGVAALIGEAPSADPAELAGQKARAARLLASRVDVRTEPMSAIVKISYDAKSPAQARDVVQAYVSSYLDHRAEIYGGGGAGDLFSGLTRDSQAQLLAIEQQIKTLKDQTGVSDVEAQKTILLARVAALQTALDAGNAQLTSTISRISALEDQRGETPREIALSTTEHEAMGIVATAETDLNKLRADLDAKMAVYLPTSPTVLQLKDQIALAEKRLAAVGDTRNPRVVGLNPTWAELDKQLATERTNLDGLDAQVQSLSREMTAARAGQATLNDVELQMGQLARERGMLVEQLRKLVEGRDFSSIDTAMGKDRVGSVVASQNATLPTTATSPNRPLLLMFGLLAATMCGAGTAALAELLDPNVGKPLDLKRLGFRRVVSIPKLAMDGDDASVDEAAADQQALRELADRDDPTSPVVPSPRGGHLVDRVRQAKAEMMTKRFDAAAAPYSARGEESATATMNGPSHAHVSLIAPAPTTAKSPLSPRFLEAARNAVERLIIAPVATGERTMPRSIAIVSITPGQGATTFATHLAAALAEDLVGQVERATRVLVVDANFERPGVGRALGLAGVPATLTALAEPQIRPTTTPRVDVLEAADASRGGHRWGEIVAHAIEGTQHLVIVDLPCMAESEAAARIAGACDAAILVVEAGEANREVVRQASQRLAESGVRLLGAVLNRRAYPIPDVLYRWI